LTNINATALKIAARLLGGCCKAGSQRRRGSLELGKSALEERISNRRYLSGTEYERSSKRFMRAMVPVSPACRILDIGCGTGLNASALACLGHEVVGVDLSPIAIEKFRARGLVGYVCDIETGPLPFDDASFDLVYASEVIEHCADTGAFLEELWRVLKPRGSIFLSTPNSAFWAYRILGLLGHAASEYQHPGHVRFFSNRSLTNAMISAGFAIVAVSARHMYLIIGKSLGDRIAKLIRLLGFEQEPRFATGDHFWQLSGFAPRASGIWADTFIVKAQKTIVNAAAPRRSV
jgi:2-polyprenyl-3-methyl-5-hydroxy-6-metoxy-1,4-benzoquinol methylase